MERGNRECQTPCLPKLWKLAQKHRAPLVHSAEAARAVAIMTEQATEDPNPSVISLEDAQRNFICGLHNPVAFPDTATTSFIATSVTALLTTLTETV